MNYPENAFILFRDGNKWCCVGADFINLQESSAGFADTMQYAVIDYLTSAIEGLDRRANSHGAE